MWRPASLSRVYTTSGQKLANRWGPTYVHSAQEVSRHPVRSMEMKMSENYRKRTSISTRQWLTFSFFVSDCYVRLSPRYFLHLTARLSMFEAPGWHVILCLVRPSTSPDTITILNRYLSPQPALSLVISSIFFLSLSPTRAAAHQGLATTSAARNKTTATASSRKTTVKGDPRATLWVFLKALKAKIYIKGAEIRYKKKNK